MSISPQNSDKIFFSSDRSHLARNLKILFSSVCLKNIWLSENTNTQMQRKKMIVSWVSFVCSKLARLEREEEAAFSLESWAQVRSLVNTRAGETDAFLTWYPGFINISSEWITLQTIILQHYIHSPHYSVIIPHDNPVIQYHSLSLDLNVIPNINPKIYAMFSSNHIKGQHLCPRVLIDYVSYPANHKDSHHLHHHTRIDFLEKLIGFPWMF